MHRLSMQQFYGAAETPAPSTLEAWLARYAAWASAFAAELLLLVGPRGARVVLIGLLSWIVVTTLALTSIPAATSQPERAARIEAGQRVAAPLTAEGAERASSSWAAVEPVVPRASSMSLVFPALAPPNAVVPSSAAPPAAVPAVPSPIAAWVAPVAAVQETSNAPAVQVVDSRGPILTGPWGGPLNTTGQDIYSCSDFETWEQALAVFLNSGPGDPNGLDSAGSGVPCS